MRTAGCRDCNGSTPAVVWLVDATSPAVCDTLRTYRSDRVAVLGLGRILPAASRCGRRSTVARPVVQTRWSCSALGVIRKADGRCRQVVGEASVTRLVRTTLARVRHPRIVHRLGHQGRCRVVAGAGTARNSPWPDCNCGKAPASLVDTHSPAASCRRLFPGPTPADPLDHCASCDPGPRTQSGAGHSRRSASCPRCNGARRVAGARRYERGARHSDSPGTNRIDHCDPSA